MATSKNIYNPYPGLRPFMRGEDKFFFGRKSETGAIIDKVLKNRFLALIGASGSGKTSLINAGIIPGITSARSIAGSSWRIIITRPGISPVESLSMAIAESANEDRAKNEEKIQSERISGELQESPQGLIESLLGIQKDKKEKILIVIDNLEDICLNPEDKDKKIKLARCEDFITLLTEARNSRKIPVHILLSIRSGFLDDCHKIGPLSHLIEESNYKLPQLNTEDLKEAIHGPIAIWGAEIETGLEKQLLRDVVGKPFQLPILQHVLSRMWDYWMEQNIDKPVSILEYEAVGGIEKSIPIAAEEAYMELTDSGRQLCEKIFKAITRKVSENMEVSNALQIKELAFITRAGIPEIIDVIGRFRQPGRCFLLPHPDIDLDQNSLVELSHESLIILWERLQLWVDEESESVSMYLRLAEASRLYQMGKSELLSEPALRQALLWKEKNEPTYQWAKRHNTAFERTMQYLSLSHESWEYFEYKKYIRSKRASKLVKVFTFTAILFGLTSIGIVFYRTDILTEIKSQVEQLVSRDTSAERQPEQPDDLTDGIFDPDETEEVPILDAIPPLTQDNDLEEAVTDEEIPEVSPQIAERSVPGTSPRDMPGTSVRELPGAEGRVLPEPEPRETRPARPEPTPTEPARQPTSENEVSGLAGEAPEALNRRMLTISQSLAVRSLQVENNPDLKALLAFQSHIFNERHNGSSHTPEILTGLITSVQHLYGNEHNIYPGHTESVNSVVFRPNSTIFYSASSDGKVLQWDVNDTSKTPRTLLSNSVVNNLLALSPNGQWLAVATDGAGIIVLNPTSNSPSPVRVNWENNRVIAIGFSDNENIIFAGSDNSLVRHNLRSGNNEVIGKTAAGILSLAVSPDGNLIAAGTRAGQVLMFQNEPGATPRIIYDEAGNDVLSLAFNRNGSRIAAGTVNGGVMLLEASTGNLMTTLTGHTARVVDIEFSPDNRLIASTSFDGSVRVWDVQNLNSRPVVLREHGSWVRSVSFSSTGNKMVTASRQEARLRAWTLNTGELASKICEKLSRNMTQAEWNQFIGEDIPYMESCPQLTNN